MVVWWRFTMAETKNHLKQTQVTNCLKIRPMKTRLLGAEEGSYVADAPDRPSRSKEPADACTGVWKVAGSSCRVRGGDPCLSSLQSFFYLLLYFPVRVGFRECRCHLLFCQTAALSIHQSSGDFVQGFETEGATEAWVYETWRRPQCQKMWHGLRPQRTIFAAALGGALVALPCVLEGGTTRTSRWRCCSPWPHCRKSTRLETVPFKKCWWLRIPGSPPSYDRKHLFVLNFLVKQQIFGCCFNIVSHCDFRRFQYSPTKWCGFLVSTVLLKNEFICENCWGRFQGAYCPEKLTW